MSQACIGDVNWDLQYARFAVGGLTSKANPEFQVLVCVCTCVYVCVCERVCTARDNCRRVVVSVLAFPNRTIQG